jgi:ABC-type transport system substrate-binding protein
MVVQEQRPPLDDANFRRALSAAIDRATLCATLFDGRAQPAGGLIAPALWAHADLPPLPFDPNLARATFARSASEVRSAERRHLTLLTSTERFRGEVARVIAQELADAGLEVDVIPLELGTMIARLNAGDFDATPDPDVRRVVYARLEAFERDAMHLVPLWYEDQVVVTSARARAFVPSAEGRWLDLARLP